MLELFETKTTMDEFLIINVKTNNYIVTPAGKIRYIADNLDRKHASELVTHFEFQTIPPSWIEGIENTEGPAPDIKQALPPRRPIKEWQRKHSEVSVGILEDIFYLYLIIIEDVYTIHDRHRPRGTESRGLRT